MRSNGTHKRMVVDDDYRPNGKGRSTKPTKKKRGFFSRRKRARAGRRHVPALSEFMGDVQLPLNLASPTGHIWMHFPSNVVDNLRQMMTRVLAKGEFPERLSIVAALPDEGVTYIARALATVMANDLAARVCLVDLNWWHPASPEIDNVRHNGLVSVISGEARLDQVFVETELPNLTLIPAGKLNRSDRPIMARSHVLTSAIDVLGRYFDHLILDIPAMRSTNDAIPLASLSEDVVLVTQQGITPIESIRLALDEIEHLNVIGTVLNQVNIKTPNLLLQYIPQD